MSNDKIPPAVPATIAIPLRWVRVTHRTPDHIAARYPYAAYGSNLALGQMAARCPGADPVGLGTLRSARLVFARYLGIIEDANASVQVGVYRLTAADIAALDRYEGLGRAYERFLVTVEMDGEAVRCFTYVKRDNAPEAPSDRYYATCLAGFTDWGMDTRRLRHAREFARKNEKPAPRHAPLNGGRYGDKFDFDDWYTSTFPKRNNATGTAGGGGDFIPDGNGTAESYVPHKSLVTGRMLPGRKPAALRYEDMRPDEIRAAIDDHDPAKVSAADRTSVDPATGQTIFVGRDGQRWIKVKVNGVDNAWRRAPKTP